MVNGGRGAWKQGTYGAHIRRGTAPSGGSGFTAHAGSASLTAVVSDFTMRRVPLPGQRASHVRRLRTSGRRSTHEYGMHPHAVYEKTLLC